MKLKGFIITLLAAVILTACASTGKDEAKLVKETDDIKALVNDYSTENKNAQNASITSQQLIVTENDGSETSYDLPKDEFFVSIAPYINETHPCTNHSLTGCQGEIVNKEFNLYIEDLDGNVIQDEVVSSSSNGFIDLWLPRDKTFQIKIEHDGKIADLKLSTFEGDPTCITTMKLMQ
ncbi:CueP family metal-binding protein [Bacillus sp. DX1.1]|uniref:CueP family metal-binding protein n=1 Tax=Bacillus sp. DX1.1 TaxID=3055866 RepID=UPI0025A0697D|nr:CueP family metal-binding protein [Bacillus sp. DX1.1]MDM5152615.1 CueP family metal-binding protein [Bacillus sp. DX1.1]